MLEHASAAMTLDVDADLFDDPDRVAAALGAAVQANVSRMWQNEVQSTATGAGEMQKTPG